MEKKEMVPYEKLSKKARREIDRRSRRGWGGMSPVTRKPESSKAYNRSREKARRSEDENGCVSLFSGPAQPRSSLS